MQCRKIQGLLKSDYLDDEVNPRKQQLIKKHLEQCLVCRRLEEELQASRILFQNAKRQQVPERVWQNIHDAIVTERLNQDNSVSHRILQRLRESILAPRPVFTLSSALMAIILIVVFAGAIIQKRQTLSKENNGESVAGYSLNDESGDLLYDLGTNVEEYFL